ncbi:MAG: DUF3806 domain-containing protein [Anaerolineales bacterium]|nr:DUF3806 domain-containing protein [Anaerolineales bacterium]
MAKQRYVCLLISLSMLLSGCSSSGVSDQEQQIYDLTAEDWQRIEEQESLVLDLLNSNYGEVAFEHGPGDLEYIQRILDDSLLDPDQTYELQSLGIVFGQVLASQTGFEWIIVDDEYGRDPALILEDTSILLFPLTMISKRVEQGEEVDVLALYNRTLEQVEELYESAE